MASSKRSGSPVEPKTTYAEWRARCAALLEGQGISAGFMREKEWRKLFIKGSTPEEAVRHAGTFYHNSRPFLERTRSTAMIEDLPGHSIKRDQRGPGAWHEPADCSRLLSGGSQDVP
jgi:hypothetical protein